jgi:hypothetical protein
MENDLLFYEKQKFTQWWVWLLLLLPTGIFILSTLGEFIFGLQYGYKLSDTSELLVSILLFGCLYVFFYLIKLETIIKAEGIYVRFFPFHFRFKHYEWEDISNVYTREYCAITEYGGWGLRSGLFGKGSAYNVNGNKGLQLEFTNGKKLLIGTQKEPELKTLLVELKR